MSNETKPRKLEKSDNVLQALKLAIASEISLQVMNTKTDNFSILPPGQIQRIFNKHPIKTEITVEKAKYNQQGAFQKPAHIQMINYLDLWISSSDYDLLKREENPSIREMLERSSYYIKFEDKLHQAIEEFPSWLQTQQKVQKSKNLTQWLEETICIPPRTVQIYINMLSEIYNL
ncbi:TPA: hypothetical protein ACIGVJ_000574 [Legionella pneumophila]